MDEGGLDCDVGHDAPLDSDMPNFLTSDTNMLPSESSSAAATSGDITEDSGAQTQRRYVSKRPHRKSRAGCKQCKKRKVKVCLFLLTTARLLLYALPFMGPLTIPDWKCDEAKPTCKACTLRKEQCIYPNVPPPVPSSTANQLPTGTTNPLALRGAREQSVELVGEAEQVESEDDDVLGRSLIPVISEPLFIPEQAADVIDMKMLWFYTAHSFQHFSINAGHSPLIDYALKVKVVEHAFRSPFLMETVKALAALDLRTLNQPVPTQKLVSYQARAFEGFRNAIETADPKDFPALLACSFFTIAISSQTFRDPNGKRLFIVDWIPMWRGIGLIIDLISAQAVQDSGLCALFYRPPIDMGKTSRYIPNNLLFMVTSIKDGDADYDYQKDYYELLKYLGSLYQELIEHGFGPVLDLRIITFFSFCPRPLLSLTKQLRPRMLVIIAYWLCFVKLLNHAAWWMRGLGPQADQIFEEIGDEWGHLLRVPRMAMQTNDVVKTARTIIDNHNWTPGELDLYHRHRDPRVKSDLKLITNEGVELEITEGQWRFKANGVRWDAPYVVDPDDESDPSGQKLLLGSSLLYKSGLRNTVPETPPPPMSTPSPAVSSESSPPGLSPSASASISPSP